MLRSAGSSPSARGPGASSNPKQQTSNQTDCSGNSLDALGDACMHFAHEHEGRQASEQQHAAVQQQPHVLSTPRQGADSDDGRRASGPVAAPHVSGQEGPDVLKQTDSESGSECSDVSERDSGGAVGDDELLDHDSDFTHCDAAVNEMACDQTQHSSQLLLGTQHASEPFQPSSAEQLCPVEHCKGEELTHSCILTQQREEEIPAARLQHFGDRGFARQHRVAVHPHLWPNRARGSMSNHVHMHHGSLQRGLQEEHVRREDSKLAAAYRRHSRLEQQHYQDENRQELQHGQTQSAGQTTYSVMDPLACCQYCRPSTEQGHKRLSACLCSCIQSLCMNHS